METKRPNIRGFPSQNPGSKAGCVVPAILGLIAATYLGLILMGTVILPWLDPTFGVRRSLCNNFKQISVAIYNYINAHGALPPAMTTDPAGQPLHSWRTLILPHFGDREYDELYAPIDLTKPWDDPANARALATAVRAYRCPGNVGPATTTTYLGLCGPDACFAPRSPRPLAQITDPHHASLMIMEAGPAEAIHWMQPFDADAAILARFPSAQTHHPGGANFAFADGSVRLLKQKIPASDLEALRTIAGGEPTPDLP